MLRDQILAIAGGFALAALSSAVQAQGVTPPPLAEQESSLLASMRDQISRGFFGIYPARFGEAIIPAATAKALGLGDGTAQSFPSFDGRDRKISRRVLFIPNNGGFILELYKDNSFSVLLLDRNEKLISAVSMPITEEGPAPITGDEAQRLCDSEKGHWHSLISRIMVD